MTVTKRQGREKLAKIEQRKVGGRSEGLRWSKQHSWLAQFTQGKSGGGEKTKKEEPKGQGSLSVSLLFVSFGSASLPALRMYFPLFSNKTEL